MQKFLVTLLVIILAFGLTLSSCKKAPEPEEAAIEEVITEEVPEVTPEVAVEESTAVEVGGGAVIPEEE